MRSLIRTPFASPPALRAVLILALLSVACGASGPMWSDVLAVGLKLGRCVVTSVLPAFDKTDAGAPPADAAPDANDASAE